MPTLTTKRIVTSTAPLPLDRYKNNIVMGFSYYKLLSGYTGYCVKVRRDSDNTLQDFGFVNGYIDYVSILAFCGAGSGFVHTWYNQYANGNNAVQATNGSQLRIVNSGVFDSNGLYFDGYNFNLKIANYDQLSILDNPLAIYTNTVTTVSSNTGYILYKGLNNSNTMHYGIMKTSVPTIVFAYNTLILKAATTPLISSTNKILYNWINKETNGFISNTNNGNANDTLNTTLTDRPNIFIGCRSGALDGSTTDTYYAGNIKSLIVSNINLAYNIISNY